MTSEIDEFRTSLVAAVQAELERHASAVVAEVDRLRDENRRERDELRSELTSHVAELAQAIEASQRRSDQRAESMQAQFESRLVDAEQRQTRRLDEVTASLEGLVAETAKPLLADVREEGEALGRRIDGLDGNLRRFDEQAARMVTYFNDVSSRMEQRQDELAERVENDVAAKVEDLKRIVDENDSAVRKFQTDVGQQVSSKLNDAEDRFNNRLLATEGRINEESGQKIAAIDLHVSRVSSNLDESLGVMNDRISAIDDRFVELDRKITQVEESVEGVNQDALDELKEKMSSAVGEAMLVRIEMERLEKSVDERTDQLAVRLTDAEQQLQDATMDVSTAVQLDRLEEIERALAEIDPTQFVRKDGDDPTVSSTGIDESIENEPSAADADSGPDLGAIIAAAEGRTTPDHDRQD